MNIVLVCNAGMSTGIMKMKLEEQLKNRDMPGKVEAVPMTELDDHLEGTDIVLLGPQIRFALNQITQKAAPRPVLAISPQDFGMMNAAHVMEEIEKVL